MKTKKQNTQKRKYPKIGLALGCGGIRGYAHIGVIKALEKNKVPIDFIAGSSVGAIIGSHYAFFKNIQKLEKIALSTNWRQVFPLMDFSFRGGLIKGAKTREFFNQVLRKATFYQLKIPFRSVATDFKTGETVELSKGEVASAVWASMSFPLFFKPVSYQNKLLFDGGVSNSVPVDIVRKMGADIIIAVNLVNKSFFDRKTFTKENYSIPQRSIYFLHYNLAKRCSKSADIIIEPRVIDSVIVNVTKLLRGHGKEMILGGEKATELVVLKIKKLIKEKTLLESRIDRD